MNASSTFVRYLIVGGVNTIFGYSVFALLVCLGWHFSIALICSTIAGILFNFQTFGNFVFGKSDWRLLWRFVAVYGFLYIVNVFLVYVLMFVIDSVYVANAFVIMFIACLGYLLNRRFVYEKN